MGKLYGNNRPPHNDWRFGDSRMVDNSRSFKDPQIQRTSRQHGDFRMQESRLHLESRMEPNYSPPPRMSDVSEMQGNERIPERVRGGPQLQREVRAHPESRMHSSNRQQGNSRIYEDLPVHDQQRSRSNAVSYDYNHQRSDEHSPLKDTSVPSNFALNSNENIRSGRGGYSVQDDNMRQGVYDALPGLPSDSISKKNIGLMPPKGYGPLSGIPPGSGHILAPSLTSSSGPQTVDGIRSGGNRGSYPKEKSSKAFDYLKTWRLKMNLPTDTFLLEKDGGAVGNQQAHDVMPPHTHDDWYTQLPTAEPRVGRASIDPEWNSSGNAFADKEGYVERPGNKYGEVRYGGYDESVASYPQDQILESDRTGNQPWNWDEEASNIQNQGAKRNYESMASGQNFNSAHRDSHYLQDEMLQSKRSRLSPSQMQNDRDAVEHYTPIVSQQGLSQNNPSFSDNAKFKVNANEPFYEPHNDWKTSSLQRRQSRSPHDARSESVGSRHKLFPGEMKGIMAREGSQASYSQSREVRNVSHNVAHSQRLQEPLGRDRYPESHLQDRAPRLTEHGRSQELNQNSMNQGRPPPNEMFMASDHYSMDMSPRMYPRSRSNRSPVKAKSPGPGMRGRSPPFSHSKSPPGPARARDRSSPWRKGKSPGLGRGRPLGPERERSPAHVGRVSPRAVGKGRSSGPGGRGGLSGPSGKQRSPGAQRLPGPARRDRSPEVARRGKSPGPLGRMRSPVSPRRGRSPGPQGRERSPGSLRRDRSSPGPLGGGRSLDHGRWKSPGRPLDHSGRGKSPELHGRDRPLGSSGRGKLPMLVGKGRSPIRAGVGRSPGPPRGPSSGPLERGRSPGKPHTGRRGIQGSLERRKVLPESSVRGSSPGPGRGKSSGTSGRPRLPGTGVRDRSPGLQGRGKQTGPSDRERSPKLHITGKSSKPIKDSSPGLMPHRAGEYQEQLRSRSPGTQRRSAKGQPDSPNHPSRGRSPIKGKSLGGARMRSGSFSQTKTRSVMKERSDRLGTRSAGSPVKRLAPGPREKIENLTGHEYGEYRDKVERSPYFEEISVSPRISRWSPIRKGVINMRSQRSRERSQSVDALQRGCSPVSPQSGGYSGRNLYPQEAFVPEREGHMQQDRATRFYRDCSPLSVDGYTAVGKNSLEIEMKGHGGNQRERFYSPSREVSFGTGRSSVEKIHNTKGNWREHEKDRNSQHYHGKKGAVGKFLNPKDVEKVSGSKFSDIPGGILSEEEVDDEDLRIHLLRLREQKVEMKLMKLEEESKETELKLWELKKNSTVPRGESPIEDERRFSEKESFHPLGRRQEPYLWKQQHLPSPEQERYHRQHKRY